MIGLYACKSPCLITEDKLTCTCGYELVNDTWCVMFGPAKSYDEAVNWCISQGGQLITHDTQEKQLAVLATNNDHGK